MKLNVLFSPNLVDDLYFTNKTTVVIDVLRATSTIIEALKNGAKEIIPVNSFEFAQKAPGSFLGGQTLLCGEKNTKKIEGFNLGNSPLEFTRESINGKSIILFTTNGSKAIVKARFSKEVIICAFTNISAVAKYIGSIDSDIEILCSGRAGGFSLEDTICAGELISLLDEMKSNLELTDAARASKFMVKFLGKNKLTMLKNSEHGKLLIENGFENDLNYCANLNSIDLVPVFSNGSIKILPQN